MAAWHPDLEPQGDDKRTVCETPIVASVDDLEDLRAHLGKLMTATPSVYMVALKSFRWHRETTTYREFAGYNLVEVVSAGDRITVHMLHVSGVERSYVSRSFPMAEADAASSHVISLWKRQSPHRPQHVVEGNGVVLLSHPWDASPFPVIAVGAVAVAVLVCVIVLVQRRRKRSRSLKRPG
jgi:hypothetical protein